jgi:hypothetical protein
LASQRRVWFAVGFSLLMSGHIFSAFFYLAAEARRRET